MGLDSWLSVHCRLHVCGRSGRVHEFAGIACDSRKRRSAIAERAFDSAESGVAEDVGRDGLWQAALGTRE